MRHWRRVGSILTLWLTLAVILTACNPPTGSPPPASSSQSPAPSGGANLAADAQKEGKVVIYSTTDSASAEPLLKEFKALYPAVEVEYNDLNSTEAYNRFTSETAAGADSADLVWSSAMDLQIKLVQDGNALTYDSPEAKGLPDGSVFQNQAWGTTLEPFVFVYNKRILSDEAVPKTHADLIKALRDNPDLYRDKVTGYNPEQSGLGYLAFVQDGKIDPTFWDLAKAMGADGVKLYSSTGTMVEKIQSGEHILGYDIIGSYVLPRAQKDPNLGMIMPKDYTLAFSRVIFIAKNAKHPNAGKLFLDYLLSKKGQETMANQSLLHAIRTDAQGEATAAALQKELGSTLKTIKVSPELLEGLDTTKRADFFQRWQQAMSGR